MKKILTFLLSVCLLVCLSVIVTACDKVGSHEKNISNEEMAEAGFEKCLEDYKTCNTVHTYEGITVRYAMYDGYSGGNVQYLGNTYDKNTAQLLEGYIFYCFSDYYYQEGEEQLTFDKFYKYDIENQTATPLDGVLLYHTDPEKEFTEVLFARKLTLMFADCSTGRFELTNDYTVLDERNTNILYDLDANGSFYTLKKVTGVSDRFEIPATHSGKPVAAIGKEAFSDNTALKEVTVPASVAYIGERAFNTPSIEAVIIADGTQLTRIEAYAFSSSGIREITIPESVEYIGYRAFFDCVNLTDIHFNARNCADFVFDIEKTDRPKRIMEVYLIASKI